jgi:hypothetical protein
VKSVLSLNSSMAYVFHSFTLESFDTFPALFLVTRFVNGYNSPQELLEAAAKVLLHQVQIRSGYSSFRPLWLLLDAVLRKLFTYYRNEQDLVPAPPRHLMQTLEARCEEFATICDQIHYILVCIFMLVFISVSIALTFAAFHS